MLPSKFGVNWPFGPGEEAKIDFQDGGHLGFPIGTILATFDLQVILMLPSKFGVNWPFGSGDQMAQGCRRSRLLKQLLTPHDAWHTTDDRHWLTTIAHHEHFVLRWANKKHSLPPSTPPAATRRKFTQHHCFIFFLMLAWKYLGFQTTVRIWNYHCWISKGDNSKNV